MTGAAAGALGRFIARGAERGRDDRQHCDLCAEEVPEQHRHVLDEQQDTVLCTCQACTLLFQRDAAGRGHYRLVPEQRLRLTTVDPKDLGVPVSLAFFVAQPDGVVVAHYPSPVGATRWEVDAERWQTLRQRWPAVAEMAPGVQALLVNTARGSDEQWIVPIDDCYRLVAVIRREWKGLSGGSTVWPAIEDFFAGLGRRPGSRLRPVHG